MRHPNVRLLLIAGAALMALCLPGHAEDEPANLLVSLPSVGRIAQIAPALTQALGGTGLTVQTSEDTESPGYPRAVMVYSGDQFEAEELEALRGYLRAGGGLVYLFGATSRHAAPAAALLTDLGISLRIARAPRKPVRLTEHLLLTGVRELPTASYNSAITGGGLAPLALQGEATIAAAGEIQGGRIALIPAPLVTSRRGEGPSPDQTKFLANACLWAAKMEGEIAGVAVAPPPVPGPREDRRPRPLRGVLQRNRAPSSADFGGTILVDILAGDDNWGLLAEALDTALRRARLPLKYLEVADGRSPLVEALDTRPALLVIGSTRRFDIAEEVAVAHYARLGGRILAIAHATPRYTIRLIDFNMILREFGVSVSLIRPQGPTMLDAHPISEGLGLPPAMPWGVSVWSVVAEPVARAGRLPYMSALERDGGRIVILDGKTLLAGTSAAPIRGGGPSPRPFGQLLDRAIDWLLEAPGG